MRQPRDWTGTRQGSVVIVGRARRVEGSRERHSAWVGQCDCGNRRVVYSNELAKGVVKTCGAPGCPFRNTLGRSKGVPAAIVSLSNGELQEALSQPCRCCGAQRTESSVLGLINPKLGYRPGNTFHLCVDCRGLQPKSGAPGAVPGWPELIEHIRRVVEHLELTGYLAAPEDE